MPEAPKVPVSSTTAHDMLWLVPMAGEGDAPPYCNIQLEKRSRLPCLGSHLPHLPLLLPWLLLRRLLLLPLGGNQNILKDLSHPGHKLLELLLSGRWYRRLKTGRTNRLNSFYPITVDALNAGELWQALHFTRTVQLIRMWTVWLLDHSQLQNFNSHSHLLKNSWLVDQSQFSAHNHKQLVCDSFSKNTSVQRVNYHRRDKPEEKQI